MVFFITILVLEMINLTLAFTVYNDIASAGYVPYIPFDIFYGFYFLGQGMAVIYGSLYRQVFYSKSLPRKEKLVLKISQTILLAILSVPYFILKTI